MCGITGYIRWEPSLDRNTDTIRKMTEMLLHRGPDGIGYLIDDFVSLGNTRLAIQDPSEAGALPMVSPSQRYWIAYNGEISNFKELKAQFFPNVLFNSGSDTEVLLHLWELKGVDCLSLLNGMFAFVLYDRMLQKAFVVRDFYGILPVFYAQTSDAFYCASELKALLQINQLDKSVNTQAIHHFLTLAYIPGVNTPWNAIHELKGGELLEISIRDRRVEKRTYDDLQYTVNHSISPKQAIETTRNLMIQSVERHLISDAPLGMTLSGGVDTSAMLGIIKHLGKSERMQTFSLKMGERSFDESPYQRLMAQFANTIHHEIEVNPDDVIETMYRQIAHIDEPNGNGACIPSFILAEHAHKHVKVLLSGEGGDELFNAYPTITAYQLRGLYRKFVPTPVRKLTRAIVHALPSDYRKLSFDFKAKRFTAGAELSVPEAHMFWRHAFTEEQKQNLLTHPYPHNPTSHYYTQLFENYAHESELNRISRTDMLYFFVDDLMVKNDRTFLANSVEGRFPFLDRDLVNYVTQLPEKYRAKGIGKLRWVEKEAMKPFIPDAIYTRNGFGLEMPHSIWFLDKLGTFAERYLNKKTVNRSGLFHWDFVNTLWQTHKAGKQDLGRPLWCILNCLIWHELFVETSNYKQFMNKPAIPNHQLIPHSQ